VKRRITFILMLVAIICLLASTVAFAAGTLNKTVNGTVTVLEPTPGMNVYLDVACTTPATSISFGSMFPGQTSTPRNLYVKNTGEAIFSSVDVTINVPGNVATTTLSADSFPLPVGEIQPVSMTMTILPGSPYGVQNFTIQFSGTY
jgi:hypothetical protein